MKAHRGVREFEFVIPMAKVAECLEIDHRGSPAAGVVVVTKPLTPLLWWFEP